MKKYDSKTVGKRLRRMRKDTEYTQIDVADKLDINNKTVSNWELGNNDISLRDAYRLVNLYTEGSKHCWRYSMDDLTKEEAFDDWEYIPKSYADELY